MVLVRNWYFKFQVGTCTVYDFYITVYHCSCLSHSPFSLNNSPVKPFVPITLITIINPSNCITHGKMCVFQDKWIIGVFYGTNCPPKDVWDLPCLLQLLTWLYVSEYRSFWNMKDGSLWICSLASFNCFTYRNLYQNGAYDMSKMINIVKDFLSKSSKFCVVWIILFCSNFTSF